MTARTFAPLMALLMLSACGPSAIAINAGIASSMLSIQEESGPIILALRESAGVTAGRESHARGEPVDVALLAASTATARWTCAIDGHRLYSLAVGTYIDAIALWQSGASFEIGDALRFAVRAVHAYIPLSDCLRSLGSDALPIEPPFLRLIPPAWEVAQ